MRIRKVQNGFFIGLLLLTTGAFLWLVQGFLQPVFWAAVLAIIFQPVHAWWRRTMPGWEAPAAVLTILTIVIVVILPLFFVGLAVTREATALYDRVAAGEINLNAVVTYVEGLLPVATEYLEQWGLDPGNLRERLSNAAVVVSRRLASEAWTVGQNAFRFSILFFLMVYLLFFFLRDGKLLLRAAVDVLPLGDSREKRLFEKFAAVSRATIKGTLVVGIVQGSLGGLAFWLLGIEGAILWGVVMTFLSLLPAVGAAVIWAPAAAVLLITGSTVKGLLLILIGTVLIGLADNVLRPILVGRDTEMPDYLVLLATLGGLTLFGISGFVIGPIIAALFLTVWDMFGDEFGTDAPGDLVTPKEG